MVSLWLHNNTYSLNHVMNVVFCTIFFLEKIVPNYPSNFWKFRSMHENASLKVISWMLFTGKTWESTKLTIHECNLIVRTFIPGVFFYWFAPLTLHRFWSFHLFSLKFSGVKPIRMCIKNFYEWYPHYPSLNQEMLLFLGAVFSV